MVIGLRGCESLCRTAVRNLHVCTGACERFAPHTGDLVGGLSVGSHTFPYCRLLCRTQYVWRYSCRKSLPAIVKLVLSLSPLPLPLPLPSRNAVNTQQTYPSMGGFGEGVSVLLDTYSRCLELLKTPVSKRHRDRADTASRSDAQSRLRASMRSDRAQIHQAYASKLSVSGSRLDKGDRKCASAARLCERPRPALGRC